MNTRDLKLPQTPSALQLATGHYKRTSVRHRKAAATVILFDSANPSKLLASATFREKADACGWMEKVAEAEKNLIMVLLDSTGIYVATSAPNAALARKAGNMAEIIWRGAQAIPRHKGRAKALQLNLWDEQDTQPAPANKIAVDFAPPTPPPEPTSDDPASPDIVPF